MERDLAGFAVNLRSEPAFEREPTGVAVLRRRIAGLLRRGFAEDRREGTPDLDARLLVAHAVGCDPSEIPLKDDRLVGADIERQAMAFAERRISGEPVARIVGHKEFYGIDFVLSPATLVPRPDTETLVNAALGMIYRQWGRGAPVQVVDLGTGSGAILLALLSDLANARGLGIDISAGAVATARDNARRLGLSNRAIFVIGDWMEPIASQADVIVANPPYVKTNAIAGLDLEVREHDPWRALDGGADGLDAIRVILSGLCRIVGNQGIALIEIGSGQVGAVTRLAAANGLAIRFERDLARIERVAVVSCGRPFEPG